MDPRTDHTQKPVYADLHTHTRCSDGTLSPDELVRRAADRGIHILAVTDHDTLAGVDEAIQAAGDRDLRVVPGVELSASLEDTEVHLLAYGFDPAHAGLQNHLSAMRTARRDRAWEMVERLRDQGVEVEDRQLRTEISTTSAVGRPHLAAALERAGHVESSRDAFEQYLGVEGPGFVPKPEVGAETVLSLIHDAGGVGVLAHPGDWTSTRQIRSLVDVGLDGLEVHHPSHRSSLRQYYQRVARGYDLLTTGGSDYHGRADVEEEYFGTLGMMEPEWERFREGGA